MSDVPPVTAGTAFNIDDLMKSGTSIQLMFAALQLKLAAASKDKAKNYMDTMTDNQNKVKECADMISRARALQNEAKTKNAGSYMPDDMVKYFNDHGLAFDHKGNDNLHNNDEWEFNIKSLSNYQETLNTGTQQQMVFVQDFMGQYNSYLTGANSAIQQSNQTLSTIARGQ
jgi:hypothetical protein